MIQPDFEEEELKRLLAMIDSGSQPEDESDKSLAMTQRDFQPQDELPRLGGSVKAPLEQAHSAVLRASARG
ncbi:MAG: hypothetical protein KME38_17355 [Spirirestis rafaelensis WJT71-NPBG6]|jgi:hypothetical protein|nr:hypothetical protein [Spirirestis rafaelensis WJT71-NPBG6]